MTIFKGPPKVFYNLQPDVLDNEDEQVEGNIVATIKQPTVEGNATVH